MKHRSELSAGCKATIGSDKLDSNQKKLDAEKARINNIVADQKNKTAEASKVREACKAKKKELCGDLKKYSEQRKCWKEKGTPECQKSVF